MIIKLQEICLEITRKPENQFLVADPAEKMSLNFSTFFCQSKEAKVKVLPYHAVRLWEQNT